jgi:ATP-dependent helicase/nuclease subunit A
LWPWPYGQQERNVHLDTVLLSSPEFKFAASRVKAENARLFYVGTTRARDLLVLAPYTGRRGSGNGLEWLTELRDKDDRPVVRMPDGDGDHKIQIKDSEHQLNICTFSIGAVSAPPTTSNPVFLPARADEKLYPPFSIRPSETISVPDIDLASIKISDIGDRITLVGTPDMETIGDCVHRFLAADRPNTSLGNRLAKAGQLRSTWNANAIKASDMLEMSDRLRSFLSKNFPDNRLYFECPIIGRLEQSRVRGFIDLLVEIPSGFLIFDHKTFPGGSESWITKASSYSGQLKNYADVLRQSIQKPVIGAYIHMPIVGKIIDLSSILTD